MNKELIFRRAARAKLMAGIDKLASAVAVTLGPKGRNVVIESPYSTPILTKDGVTVADSVNLPDPVEHMGAMMVKQVAIKTVRQTGDGTTTATILAQAISKRGLKALDKGANPMDLKKGIDKAVSAITEYLKKVSEPVKGDLDKIMQVATIASNGDEEVGHLIQTAISKVTSEGVIIVEESKTAESSVTVTDGMEFERGFLAPDFMNNNKGECEFLNPYILITDKRVNSVQEILDILLTTEQQHRPLVIISNDMENTTVNSLIKNKVQSSMPICVVKCPGFGDERINMLTDIAILTGGEFIGDGIGIKLANVITDIKKKDGNVISGDCKRLGSCEKIIITAKSTTIVKGNGDKAKIESRVGAIKSQISMTESEVERDKLQARIAKLKYGVAIIRIGATTDLEMKEKKDRVDDALGATKAAVAEGIVPGGGTMYIRALSVLKELRGENRDESTGIDIVRKAIERPLWQIADNAGQNGDTIVSIVKEFHGVSKRSWFDNLFSLPDYKGGDYGYNARTGEFEDLKKAGVIDPTKVIRVALENSASIAAMFLTTEVVITNIKEK